MNERDYSLFPRAGTAAAAGVRRNAATIASNKPLPCFCAFSAAAEPVLMLVAQLGGAADSGVIN